MAEGKSIWDNKNVKTVLGIAGIISIILLITKLFAENEKQKSDRKIRKEKLALYEEIPPSYSDLRYREWGNILDSAINNGFTTDNDTIFNIYAQQKNISDIEKLNSFYGTRRITFTLTSATLPQSLSTRMSMSAKKVLNALLKKNKIDYSF